MEEISASVLHCSARHFVETIQRWGSDLVGAPLPLVRIKFDHQPANGGERDALQQGWSESLEQCSGGVGFDYTCWSLVVAQAEIGFKGLAEYLIGLLQEPENAGTFVGQSHAFGWLPVHRYFTSARQGALFEHHPRRSARIEVGGGSGAGFQIYCNGTLLATAGGGGGGGLEGNLRGHSDGLSGSYSLGGGGGGGAQINETAPEILSAGPTGGFSGCRSIGGGSGCGTCDGKDAMCKLAGEQRTSSHDRPILCGAKLDDETLGCDATSARWGAQALRDSMVTCQRDTGRLWIEGGGGGGGGTAECCGQFMTGYGFGFVIGFNTTISEMEPRRDEDREEGAEKSSTILDGEEIPFHDNALPSNFMGEEPESGTKDEQYKWDKVGALMHAASEACDDGWGDWCCLCTEAKRIRASTGCCTSWEFVFLEYEVCCKSKDGDSDGDDGSSSHPRLNGDAPPDTHPWTKAYDNGMLWDFDLDALLFKGHAIPRECESIELALGGRGSTHSPSIKLAELAGAGEDASDTQPNSHHVPLALLMLVAVFLFMCVIFVLFQKGKAIGTISEVKTMTSALIGAPKRVKSRKEYPPTDQTMVLVCREQSELV